MILNLLLAQQVVDFRTKGLHLLGVRWQLAAVKVADDFEPHKNFVQDQMRMAVGIGGTSEIASTHAACSNSFFMNSIMVSVLSLPRVFFIRSCVDFEISYFLGFFLLRGMN